MSETPRLSGLKVYHVEVRGVARERVWLPEGQPGMALRGGFFDAMWERFCTNKASPSCAACPLHTACPVSALVAPLRDEGSRGQDVPRPYSIRPAGRGEGGATEPGQEISFGLTLFGRALPMLPYVVMSAQEMGRTGVGARMGMPGRRGRFDVTAVDDVNLLDGGRHPLLNNGRMSYPDLATTWLDVQARVQRIMEMNQNSLEVELVTPMRLVDNGMLVRRFALRPLLQRLTERVTALAREYGEGDEETVPQGFAFHDLFRRADSVTVVEDKTVWKEIKSYSARKRASTPIGGLVGRVRLKGDLSSLLPWLVWGEVVQAGKDVVKGNGWYILS